jgi:hypothetical protein
MNTTNKLIGKKVKGFKFEDGKYNGLEFSKKMNRYIGEIGEIIEYNETNNRYKVEFKDDYWLYPAELIEQHLVEETPLDDLPMIGDGVLMEVSGNDENWFQYNVIGKNKHGFFIAWDSENFSTNLWKHARPITPKTKITRKEFESKFEIID